MSIDFEIPRYTMLKEIGSGGMAVVYLATQRGLDRPVAVKVLRKSLTGHGDEFRKRFEHEGKMLAQLEHENIVKIYDIGSNDDAVYMVMEYLKGGTLSHRMQAGDLTVSDIIKIVAQIGMALHAAHHQNIIHRDLKPSNIMFRDPITPVLTDFGIARQIDTDMSLTETGMMIGTPQYMSPEQVQGKPVDGRSDIYSLGLMFYRLLTGELPFKATDHIALAMQQIQEPPPPLPPALSELQPVMDLMLAKAPDDRYANCIDLCNHLRTISLTDADYANELSAATRIFSSASLRGPEFRLSGTDETTRPATQKTPATFTSLSGLITAVKTRKKARYGMFFSILLLAAGVFTASQYFSSGLSEAEERRVLNLLNRFEGHLTTNNYYEPADENATDTLKEILRLAPNYGRAKEAADELAIYYESDAVDRFEDGDFEEAMGFIQRGLEFAPENDGLLETRNLITAAITEKNRLEEIESYLALAGRSMQQGNLLPPATDNAFDAFQSVKALDPNSVAANSGLSDIQRQLVEEARTAWMDNDDIERAKVILGQVANYFPDSTLVSDLEAQIAHTERLAQEQAQITTLLTQAQEQVDAGKFVEPVADNAVESYKKVLEISPGEQSAVQGLQSIADHYLELANQLYQDEQFQLSIDAASAGLRAMPNNRSLELAQSEATNRLDARSQEIQTRLQLAQRLIQQGALVPDLLAPNAGATAVEGVLPDNALDAFRSVDVLDPGNQQAQAGLAALPQKIIDTALQYQRDGAFTDGRSLLIAATAQYPENTRYPELIDSMDRSIAEQQERVKLEEKLRLTDQLLQQRPVGVELVDQMADAVQELAIEFPNEVSVAERQNRLIRVIEDEAIRLSAEGLEGEAIVLVEHSLILYPGNSQLTASLRQAKQSRIDREEQERLRIAAMSGQLAIDARPWGRVVEIRDANLAELTLPDDTETPFVHTLPEGTYSVRVIGGDSDASQVVSIEVRRQSLVSERLEFGTLTAQSYFEKSGW
jgi:serine/threonine protein kinase